MPNLYIIAGCNGAGKTTASFTILPEILDCKEFVNADEIAKGLSPFQPENVSFQAGRLMLERVDELLNNRSDFAFETTLTTLSYLNTIKEAKVKGYSITLLFFWALAILFVKGRKVKFQRKILALNLIPQDPNFFLNNATARDALLRIRGQVDDPKHFLLLNRIDVALSNLQNIGEISEVASLTNAQASIDEDQVSASYSLINGFNWAIPVLGFIGTVLGLGSAIGEFGVTIQLADDVDKLKNSLTDVTGGLSTAFDTTLLGLVASIVVQMVMTFRKRQEFLLLDECNEYCQTYVLAKLKLEKSGRGRS